MIQYTYDCTSFELHSHVQFVFALKAHDTESIFSQIGLVFCFSQQTPDCCPAWSRTITGRQRGVLTQIFTMVINLQKPPIQSV